MIRAAWMALQTNYDLTKAIKEIDVSEIDPLIAA